MPTHAVIATGGKQYLVTEGQTLRVEKLAAEPKATVNVDRVLLVTDGTNAKLGTPNVGGASVKLEVQSHGLGKKIYVETYHAKTRKHRKIGHRQAYTQVKVEKITS